VSIGLTHSSKNVSERSLTEKGKCVKLLAMTVEAVRTAVGEALAEDGDRRAVIHAAAIREFSARGFAATSMANIADAAGMSRPALYQYFRNKGDILASAFTSLMDVAVDAALAALSEPGTTAERLERCMQRFDGDLWERMSASPHSDELLRAKYEHAADAGVSGLERLHEGLLSFFARIGAGGRGKAATARRAAWVELLELAPRGFKLDRPSPAVFRQRLTTLARSVAADIEA
jgi:AcrR family transcriptional regulator